MVSTKSLIATAFAGFAFCSFANAQNLKTMEQKPISGPLERVVYDIETGKVTRLGSPATASTGFHASNAEVANTANATANCFLNLSTMGFFSTGTTDTEWRDWALKDTGKTGLVTQFYFSYATSANDPSNPVPGPGASIEIAFYSGETGFCSTTGAELANSRFCFTALPGAGGTLGSNMGAGFLITAFVPTAQLFCAPDGKLGWSYGFKDNNGSGSALSGPVMTSFVSENTCAADAFDLYNRRPSTTGTCLGSFFFQGCEPLPQPPPPAGMSCATFYVGLGEDDGSDLASSSSWNPTGCNEDDYVALSDPVIGGTWEVGVDNTPGVDPAHDRVGVVLSLAEDSMNGNKCFQGGFKGVFNNTALYARPTYLPGATAQSFFLEGTGMSPAPPNFRSFSTPVGKELDLVGARFCTMGYSLDFPNPLDNRFLSNALVIEVGTSL